jgi:hypothetical protein
MSVIHFRFYQVCTSVVADERRSLALIHVDGESVRFAWNDDDPPPMPAEYWRPFKAYLKVLRRKVMAMPPTEEALRMLAHSGLRHGGTYWTEVRTGHAGWPQAQFEECAKDARLVVPA